MKFLLVAMFLSVFAQAGDIQIIRAKNSVNVPVPEIVLAKDIFGPFNADKVTARIVVTQEGSIYESPYHIFLAVYDPKNQRHSELSSSKVFDLGHYRHLPLLVRQTHQQMTEDILRLTYVFETAEPSDEYDPRRIYLEINVEVIHGEVSSELALGRYLTEPRRSGNWSPEPNPETPTISSAPKAFKR